MDILYFFVEGLYDKKFLDNLYSDLVEITGIHNIRFIQYQQKKKKHKKINGLIRGIKKRKNDYFFISDLDSHTYPCITRRKDNLIEDYGDEVEINKIIIVKEEIESWYFSGLTNHNILSNPQNLSYTCSKEEFDNSIPRGMIKNDLVSEVMKSYDMDLAISNNESFKYFIQKLKSISTN